MLEGQNVGGQSGFRFLPSAHALHAVSLPSESDVSVQCFDSADSDI